jgi:hypothetical protein
MFLRAVSISALPSLPFIPADIYFCLFHSHGLLQDAMGQNPGSLSFYFYADLRSSFFSLRHCTIACLSV